MSAPSRLVMLNVLGRRVRVPFEGSAEQYAWLVEGQRRRAAMKRRLLGRARRATGADKVKAVDELMLLLGSHERIGCLLPLIEHEPAPVFWPCFLGCWLHCDNTGEFTARLVEALRRVGPCNCYEHADDGGEFFRSLPDQITLYRGASRECANGISWTTNKSVALNFARGHRGIRVLDPVLATATIAKASVFFATDDRSEQEIICAPHSAYELEAV